MTRKIEQMTWPGGEHDFQLRYGEIEALQQRCDAGPEYILQSMMNGTYRQGYLFNTLRLGLIGAGMDEAEARDLLHRLQDDVPLRSLVMPAQSVLTAALIGAKDDDIPAPPGEEQGVSHQPPEESGGSQPSTEAEPS